MSEKRTLYVSRRLLNASDVLTWARSQGFDKPIAPNDLHVTIAFSRKVVDWSELGSAAASVAVPESGDRTIEKLGDKGAVVLRFESSVLADRWKQFCGAGASWDWPEYKPHVTLTYEGTGVDLAAVDPFAGPLEFGPEVFAAVDENWTPKVAADARDQALALDRASLRTFDRDGHLHVASTNISKANVCPYYGREIPDWEALGLQADTIYQLLRDPDELARAAGTFNGKPLLDEHKPVTADDHDHDRVVGSVSNVTFEPPYLKAHLSVWDGDSIRDIESGKQRQLSSAYRYRADMMPGTYEGTAYDGVMRDISANHVALVKEGRAGPDVLVGDSAIDHHPRGQFSMSKIVLTRKAAVAQGALAVYLRPKLAQDAKVDLTALLKDVTVANFAASKPKLAADIAKATKGKLAKDADLGDVTALLDVLEEMTPEEVEAVAQDEDETDEEKKAREAKEAKDKKAAADKSAKDEDKDDDDKKDKKAMDSAIKAAVDGALAAAAPAIRKETLAEAAKIAADIRDAERAVRPYVGELAMAHDSADAVYRTALTTLGVKLDGVHPSAFPAILAVHPKPGEQRRSAPAVALDAASVEGFAKRYPDASRIRVL